MLISSHSSQNFSRVDMERSPRNCCVEGMSWGDFRQAGLGAAFLGEVPSGLITDGSGVFPETTVFGLALGADITAALF